jgi:hypothetical protein
VVVDAKDIMRSDVQGWIDEYQALPKTKRKKLVLADFIRDKIEAVVDGDKYVWRAEGESNHTNHILLVIMDDIDSYDHATGS